MADGKLPAGGNLRDRPNAFADNGGMKVVLVEPSATERTVLVTRLRGLGIEVAPFQDP